MVDGSWYLPDDARNFVGVAIVGVLVGLRSLNTTRLVDTLDSATNEESVLCRHVTPGVTTVSRLHGEGGRSDRLASQIWRSRWAAVGAAVAISLGAGGAWVTHAASPPSSLVMIQPARILDTPNPTNLEVVGCQVASGGGPDPAVAAL